MQPHNQIQKSKNMLLKGSLILASVSLTVLLIELGVRLWDPPPRMLKSLNFAGYVLSDNPTLKYEYKPGLFPMDEAQFSDHRNFLINADGFRDREFSAHHPPDLIRIIVLGDSVTTGNGIPNPGNVYPALVQKILNHSSGRQKYEVYNMAVGGYHTLQEVETLRVKGLKYKPDLVLIGFCINDFDLEVDGGVYQKLQQQLGGAEKKILERMYQQSWSWFHYFLSKSRLLFFLYYRTLGNSIRTSGEFEYQRDILQGKDPVSVGLALLDRLQQEHGFRSYLFIIPALVNNFNEYGFRHIHHRVEKICEHYPEIQIYDTLPDFKVRHENGSIFSIDGLHPNEYGHQVLAKVIAGKLLHQPQSRKTDLH
ncbi:SGNH/GDSL hydrolase family protein [candidate division CSSED10-310 bacterium]|uniref:SGNH/GDSL hydrolase family protein n=1 Tax=candidate division CSSED10-310 bacterium TaxID=2855610 RepID=A0ABV6YU93_UNCC1